MDVYEDAEVVVRPSPIEGLGVFAKRAFKTGEIVIHWHPTPLTEQQMRELPEDQSRYMQRLEDGSHVHMNIPERYVNSSETPNTHSEGQADIALSDIAVGEEITSNYFHHMRLHPRPFELVASGSKTIEIRLNDEKRRQLKVGDQIEFISRTTGDKVLVEISALPTFATFKELCDAFPPQSYGSESTDDYKKMYEYYSKTDEARYGVIGVRFTRL